MRIGVPKEIKAQEYRVGLHPLALAALIQQGHRVLVESGAGLGSGYSDEEYQGVGATLVSSVAELYRQAELIVKVKEPQAEEVAQLRPGQIVCCYLHLAPNRSLTDALIPSCAHCIADDTLTDH